MTVLKKIFKHFLVSTNKYLIHQRHWHQYVTHFLSRPALDWGEISRKKFNNFEKKSVIFLHQWDLFCYICLQLNEKRFWSCSLILKKEIWWGCLFFLPYQTTFWMDFVPELGCQKHEERREKGKNMITFYPRVNLNYHTGSFFFYYII